MPSTDNTTLSPAPDPAAEGTDTGADTGPKTGIKRDLNRGLSVIQAHVKTLPTSPGVYRMLNDAGDALYVGKAKNLKHRVTSYTQIGRHPARLMRMIAETTAMEFVVTASEVEALLLEANLIKRLKPRYNVLLRDDKTFPHILIASDHPFPQVTKHRGTQKRPGNYFGPFASAGAVNRTITALQRAFMLRNCSDAVFASRSRPCLQYQIKRCTAPCVGYVDEATYADQAAQAQDFLAGRSQKVQQHFADAMVEAADKLDFEAAARYRDRIRALASVQSHQDINVEGFNEADAISCYGTGGQSCVQVYFVRAGRNYGTRAYFPSHDKGMDPAEILSAFVGQFYDDKPPPKLILLSHSIPEQELLAEALSVHAGHKVSVLAPQRGAKKRLIDHAMTNANEALARRLAESASQNKLLAGVAEAFGLEGSPARIEVYDNSHIGGTNAIGAMIVAGPEGFQKNAYRKFTIKTEIAPGDDYAMMREVLSRRFARALKEDPDRSAKTWPDLVVIDGGQGQLAVVMSVLDDLGIGDVPIVSIAKGPDRNAGRERFFMPDRPAFSLPTKDPILYYLQRLRDEAHRFAIGTHRAKRQKQIGRTVIDDVPGIGPRRKKALLMHFGSGKAVGRASIADLEAVDGISRTVAKKIYDHFNPNG